MSDLHERFRTLDYLPEPDLWNEIESRATAVPTRSVSSATPILIEARAMAAPAWSVSRSTSILIAVGLLLAVLAGAAIFASGMQPQPIPAETPSQTPLASPPASPALNVEPQGKWVATGGMLRRRTEGHSVTLLGDGRVLVAGGDGAMNGAELYDPATGTWTATGNLFEPRSNHTATLLPDGRVLVAGGVSSFATEEVLASAELYDPITGTWTAAARLTVARHGHTATLLPDGRVLIAGGRGSGPESGGADSVELASAETYDPVRGLWTGTTAMPERRDAYTATMLPDGRVLFVGRSAQLYDPATASWTPTDSMARRDSGHFATLLRDGRVLVTGCGFPFCRSAELYDPQTDSWTQTGDMIERRAWFAAGLLPDGRVLVTGGGDGGYGGSPTAELYDPDTGTWTLTPNMLSEHGYHEGVTLNDGRFLVVGGFGPALVGGASAETYGVGGDQ